MPIKYTGTPWIFKPSLNSIAKVLLISEMQCMIQYFMMAHGCKNGSYVITYFDQVKEEVNFSDFELERAINVIGDIKMEKEVILKELVKYLSSSRQKRYCRDILNTTALHIHNEVNNHAITRMLNEYIDNCIDVILS
ncbi:MAG: hypothetical protein J6K31_05480 [Parabacteroides sp.]|nr:hypothetical protein [Parabacteroides sp.]